MTVYVYCPRPSNGALELVRALGATRLRKFDGMRFFDKKRRFLPVEGDVVVCWGTTIPELDGVHVLNGAPEPVNKLKELNKFQEAGVPTVSVAAYADKRKDGEVTLPRKVHHIGGGDLLITPAFPDYYVVKENFTSEYRIHSFAGKSIRAGVKVHREGFTLVTEQDWKPNQNLVHPWIRSFDAGWRVKYDGFTSTPKQRALAHKAVAALGLVFGAVDIAELPSGKLKVLEVNRAPGIEGNSISTYVRAIQKWIESAQKGNVKEQKEGVVKDEVRGAGVEELNPF